MNDSQQKAGKHEPNSHFRVDPRASVIRAVKISDLVTQPREVQHLIDTNEDVVVWNELS
jgi:hypothetical protein